MHFDLEDSWRKQNQTKKFTFQRGNSKSRIDHIFSSKEMSSKILKMHINHFPISDHDLVAMKTRGSEWLSLNRSPG